MTRQSLNETSSAWFHANPIDISTIHLVDPDQIDQEVFNQVHAIDSQSSSEIMTLETDSDTLKSDPEKTCTIQQDGFTFDQTTLSSHLDVLATTHFETERRCEEKRKLEKTQRSTSKYKYFPDSDEEPNKMRVSLDGTSDSDIFDSGSGESEGSEDVDCIKTTHKRKKSSSKDPYQDLLLTYKFRTSTYIPPIDNATLDHLNGKVPTKVDPIELEKSTKKTKKILESSYRHLNDTTREKTKKKAIEKSEEFRKKSESTHPKQSFSIEKIGKRKRPIPLTETRELAPLYDPKPIIPRPPSFLNPRPIKERPPPPPPTQTINPDYDRRPTRVPKAPEPEPIPSVKKEPIPNCAPRCADPRRGKKAKSKINETVTIKAVKLTEESQPSNENSAFEQKLRLDDMINDQVYEFELPPPPKEVDSTSDDEDNDFLISDDELTNEDEEAQGTQEFGGVRRNYVDPYETKSVRMRNQAIRQRLKLRDAQRELEEAEMRERERKNHETAREIAPTLKKLEEQTTYQPEPLEYKLEKFKRDSQEANAVIVTAIVQARYAEPLVQKEARRLARQGKMNKKEREEKERAFEASQRALKERAQRNQELRQLWAP